MNEEWKSKKDRINVKIARWMGLKLTPKDHPKYHPYYPNYLIIGYWTKYLDESGNCYSTINESKSENKRSIKRILEEGGKVIETNAIETTEWVPNYYGELDAISTAEKKLKGRMKDSFIKKVNALSTPKERAIALVSLIK